MMNIKPTTQAYATSEQNTIRKGESQKHVSAADHQKHFGDQNVGEILNKVSDPNWTDPSKKIRTAGDNQLGKDAFLKLLLTQLKHQDPTNPLKSHEMAAQLAQFTSLEKLTNIDDGIGKLKQAVAPTNNYDALNLIGKAVSGDSTQVIRSSKDEKHSVRFELAGDAQKVKLKIMNAQGESVREIQFGELKEGKNELNWNGMLENGTPAKPGEYKVKLEAIASNGRKIFAQTKFEGVITGVNFSPTGPVLMIGNQSVRLSDVDKIIDPKLLKPTQKMAKGPQEQGIKPTEGNMENVSMSREMVNEVNSAGGKAGL